MQKGQEETTHTINANDQNIHEKTFKLSTWIVWKENKLKLNHLIKINGKKKAGKKNQLLFSGPWNLEKNINHKHDNSQCREH